MTDLLVLAAAGVGAWSMRASAIVLARGRTLPGGVTQALAYAKHAVLAGVVGTALATSASSAMHVVTPQPLAALLAGAVAWRTRGVLRTLLAGVAASARLVYADYSRRYPPKTPQPLDVLDSLSMEMLSDESRVASLLDLGPQESPVTPRGYRLLDRIPRLPDAVKDSLVGHFGDLQPLLAATVADLDQVEGVGRARARQLRRFFDRLLDSSRGWEVEED